MLRHCQTKKIDKIVINLRPLLSTKNSRNRKFSATLKGSSTKKFSRARQNVSKKIVRASPIEKKPSEPKIFLKTEMLLWEIFGHCDLKKFKKDRDSPSYLKAFLEPAVF